jgi:hypothetical protein
MSQIPRSQFALKKRQPYTYEGDHQNGNSKAKKTDNFDNDVLIIDDNMFAVVGHEEVIATHEEDPSPGKRKRSRKSKDSTESKDSDFGKSPSARKSSTNGSSVDSKIVKASFEDFTAKQRRSRADRLQNASTIVNLSTVSTTESTIRDETIEATPTRTSGRRSARPIDEIKFEYRTTDLDDSLNTTTNATIGSEANDSIATPGDRKRHINDDEEVSDSPKRSRLDLSGLFSSFSSPVTLLRNRFKRTNIGASTPVVAGEIPALNDSIESLEEITSSKEDEAPVEEEKEEELEIVTTPITKKKACIIM